MLWLSCVYKVVRGNAFGIPPNGAVASRFGGGLRHFPEQWLNAIETAPSHCSVDRSRLPSVGANDQRPGGSAACHRPWPPFGRHETITVGYTPSTSKILRIFPADGRIAARTL